jgi:hypothetical protein
MKMIKQRGAVSLLATAVIMMSLTIAAMVFLYAARYGHLPFQQVWSRWGKAAGVIQQELKSASGIAAGSDSSGATAALATTGRPAAGLSNGIRRCLISGKVTYSDNACADDNPTSRAVTLHDSKSDAPKKPPIPSGSEDGPDGDLKAKMIERLTR